MGINHQVLTYKMYIQFVFQFILSIHTCIYNKMVNDLSPTKCKYMQYGVTTNLTTLLHNLIKYVNKHNKASIKIRKVAREFIHGVL